MLEIIIPLLVFVSVVFVGGAVLVSRAQKRKLLEMRLHNKEVGKAGEKILPKLRTFQFLQKIGNFVSHGRTTTTLYEQLVRAGYLKPSAPAIYIGVKMMLFLAGILGTTISVASTGADFMTKATLIFLGGSVLFFVPNIVVSMRLKKRHEEIQQHLPEALDLLEICVSSGIGLDMAWNIVADEIQHVSPVLASAMTLTNFEIHLGANRAEAMRHMGNRTGVQELSSLAAVITQSERFGTSLALTLKTFAAGMREERSFTAEEKGEKMAVKLIVPMVLFIFPAVLITVVGPAIISIARELIFKG